MLVQYYKVQNMFFLGSVASILPFFWAFYRISKSMPCPPCHLPIALVAMMLFFIVGMSTGYVIYGNVFIGMLFAFTLGPWVGVICMVAQLYIWKRGYGDFEETFSPALHLPVIGILGSASFALIFVKMHAISWRTSD